MSPRFIVILHPSSSFSSENYAFLPFGLKYFDEFGWPDLIIMHTHTTKKNYLDYFEKENGLTKMANDMSAWLEESIFKVNVFNLN